MAGIKVDQTDMRINKRIRRNPWKQEIRKNWPLYLLCLPALGFVLIFSYGPMAGLVMAFQDYKPWLASQAPPGSAWIISTEFSIRRIETSDRQYADHRGHQDHCRHHRADRHGDSAE